MKLTMLATVDPDHHNTAILGNIKVRHHPKNRPPPFHPFLSFRHLRSSQPAPAVHNCIRLRESHLESKQRIFRIALQHVGPPIAGHALNGCSNQNGLVSGLSAFASRLQWKAPQIGEIQLSTLTGIIVGLPWRCIDGCRDCNLSLPYTLLRRRSSIICDGSRGLQPDIDIDHHRYHDEGFPVPDGSLTLRAGYHLTSVIRTRAMRSPYKLLYIASCFEPKVCFQIIPEPLAIKPHA